MPFKITQATNVLNLLQNSLYYVPKKHLVETNRHDVQTTWMDISVQKDVTAKNINIVIMCMDV